MVYAHVWYDHFWRRCPNVVRPIHCVVSCRACYLGRGAHQSITDAWCALFLSFQKTSSDAVPQGHIDLQQCCNWRTGYAPAHRRSMRHTYRCRATFGRQPLYRLNLGLLKALAAAPRQTHDSPGSFDDLSLRHRRVLARLLSSAPIGV